MAGYLTGNTCRAVPQQVYNCCLLFAFHTLGIFGATPFCNIQEEAQKGDDTLGTHHLVRQKLPTGRFHPGWRPLA